MTGFECRQCRRYVPTHDTFVWYDYDHSEWIFCSRECADFHQADREADDLAYVKRSLGMAVCDA